MPIADLLAKTAGTASNPIRGAAEPPAAYVAEIAWARDLQLERSGCLNAHLDAPQTEAVCECAPEVLNLLHEAAQRLQLSARGYFRTLRVARTITDLAAAARAVDESPLARCEAAGAQLAPEPAHHSDLSLPIDEQAVAEALSYRPSPST